MSEAKQLNIVYVKDESNEKDWFYVELKENKGDWYYATTYCDYADAKSIDQSDVVTILDDIGATLIYNAETDEIEHM